MAEVNNSQQRSKQQLDAWREHSIEMARAAGDILQEMHAQARTSYDVKSGGLADVVTAADKAAEKYVSQEIKSAWPDAGIIGEEGTRTNPHADVQFVIDPLDGTMNYVQNIPLYAVSIGVEVDRQPVVGVIYHVDLNHLYVASLGNGAWLDEGDGARQITASTVGDIPNAVIALDSSGHPASRARHYPSFAQLGEAKALRRIGSAAIGMAWASCGKVDGHICHGASHWDVSAGSIIAREAGAALYLNGLAPTDPPNSITVVGAPALVKELRFIAGAPPQ